MKRRIAAFLIGLVVAGLFLLVGSALAQTPAAPAPAAPAALPSAEQVLEKYVTALGGKAAIEKVTSRVAKGTFDVPEQGAGGTIEMYAKAPNKRALTIVIDGFGTIRQAFNGTAAWADDPQQGLRDISGDELENQRRQSDMYGALHLADNFGKMTVKSKDKVGQREAWLVEADGGNGRIRKFYFDAETGLLLRVSAQTQTPQGPIDIDSYLEDYKDVDGVKVPFTTRQETPYGSRITRFKEVQHNVPVDDKVFEKP